MGGERRWDGPSSERQKQIEGPVQVPEEILTDHVLFCLLSRMTAGAKMTAETFGESARHGGELIRTKTFSLLVKTVTKISHNHLLPY